MGLNKPITVGGGLTAAEVQTIIDAQTTAIAGKVDAQTTDIQSRLDSQKSSIETSIINQTNSLNTSIDDVKKSGSDSKTAVANAITGKGINTATDAAVSTMVANIGNIITLGDGTADATATAAQILSGYTAYSKGQKLTGTATSGKRCVTGTITSGTGKTGNIPFIGKDTGTSVIYDNVRRYSITDLPFTPSFMAYYSTWGNAMCSGVYTNFVKPYFSPNGIYFYYLKIGSKEQPIARVVMNNQITDGVIADGTVCVALVDVKSAPIYYIAIE